MNKSVLTGLLSLRSGLFMILIVFITMVVFCSCGESEKKPNILFILADDLGYSDLSCMGSEFYETPNIDHIAGEGMLFTDGYSGGPNCSPSRATIMTGKFTVRHGITDYIGYPSGTKILDIERSNKLNYASSNSNLPHEFITLPEALREAGYKTFIAGKWHLGAKGSWAADHGFDYVIQGADPGTRGGYFSPYERSNLLEGENGEEHSMRMVNETIRFIGNNDPEKTGQPFFAFLSFDAVHGPVQTNREKWAKYREKAENMGIAESGFTMGHFLPIRQVQDNPVYAGLIEAMDDAVGVLLDALIEMGLEKNTVIIFTSDNGGVTTGEFYSTSNLPLKAGKGYLYEGGIRIPFIIKIPWLDIAGKTCRTPVTGADIYPTFLDLAGEPLRPGEHNDGISLRSLLEGGTLPERSLIWHFPHYSVGGEPSSVIRKGDWKLIHFYENGKQELYKISEDIGETNDIAEENPALTKQLSMELFSFLDETEAKFPGINHGHDEDHQNKYIERAASEFLPLLEERRLGYLSDDFDPGNNWWGSEISKE